MIGRLAISFVGFTAAAGLIYWKGYHHAEVKGRAALLDLQVEILQNSLTETLNENEAFRSTSERGAEAEAEAAAMLSAIGRDALEVVHVTPPACDVPDLDTIALGMRDQERLRARRDAALRRAGGTDDGGA